MALVRVDTDIGGDTDDLCAIAMLLERPRVELAGVTTPSDEGGMWARLACCVLRFAGREDVAVAAGRRVSSGATVARTASRI